MMNAASNGNTSTISHSVRKLYSYEQVARDVQRVWSNCRQYIGHQSGATVGVENPFLEAVAHLEGLWTDLYNRHVLKLVDTQKKSMKKKQESLSLLSKGLVDLAPVSNISSSVLAAVTTKTPVSSVETNEAALELPHNRDVTSEHHVSWSHCASVLSLWDYFDLPANTRLNLLSWLCFEIMDTDYISTFMTNLTSLKIPMYRACKTGEDDGSDEEAAIVSSTVTPGKSKLSAVKKRLSSSSLIGQEGNNSSSSTSAEGAAVDDASVLGYSVMRWTGLGKDRDGRLYWSFNAPDINKLEARDESGAAIVLDEMRENRLYCEDVVTGEWIIYDRTDDINSILAWLTDKSICESQLQKALITWMKASEIPITVNTQTSVSKRPRKSMNTDDGALGDSENIPLLSSIRNKSTTEPSDYARHWMPKCTHSVAVLVDIYLVDGITSPGIVSNRADNNVVVTGFRRDANDRSLGEEAGLRLGDMLLAANGRAINGSVEVIREAMSAILQPDNSSSSAAATTTAASSSFTDPKSVKSRKSNSNNSNSAGSATDGSESVSGAVTQIFNTVFETSPRLQLLVLRKTDPMTVPGFRELSLREPLMKPSWNEFNTQQKVFLSATVSEVDGYGDLIRAAVGSSTDALASSTNTTGRNPTATTSRRRAAAAAAEAEAIAKAAAMAAEADAFASANAAAAKAAVSALSSSQLSLLDQLNPMSEKSYYAGAVVGGLLDLLIRTNHPYAVPDEWTDRRNEWVVKLFNCMAEISKSYSFIRTYKHFMQIPIDGFRAADKSKVAARKSQGIQYIKHLRDNLHQARLQLLSVERACLLEFEQALYLGGNILTSDWLDNRVRQKWQLLCQQVRTTAQVSLACFQLMSAIDFKRLASAGVCMSRKKWFETGMAKNFLFYSSSSAIAGNTKSKNANVATAAVASSATKKDSKAQQTQQQQVVRSTKEEEEVTQLSIPAEGSVVIYFGDGHFESLQRGQANQLPKMWGESASPYRGQTFLCIVKNVRVLLCGSPESVRCFPFAQIDLLVVDKNPYASTPQVIRSPTSDHAGMTYRLVNRLINALEHSPESVPFLTAVNVTDHPDYLKIVKKPIDLSVIKKKARNGVYSTCELLKADVTLLRDNCHKYCSELYPELVAYVDQLYEEFCQLYDLLSSELSLQSSDSNDNVNVKRGSSSSSSSSSIVTAAAADGETTTNSGISFQFPAKIVAEKHTNILRFAPMGSGVRGIFKAKDTLPVPVDPSGGPAGAFSSSFTVCVRLGEGGSSLEASPFLVELDLYKRQCESVEVSSRVVLKASVALPHLCKDTVQGAPCSRLVSNLLTDL